MELLFLIVVIITLITIVFSGCCTNVKNDPVIVAMIEDLSSNLLCLSLQFLPLSDYEIFFSKYKLPPQKTKYCRVQYEHRFYGKNYAAQEFFNFHYDPGGEVMSRWFPRTIKQFASYPLLRSSKKTVEIILYKNGFFDIDSKIPMSYRGNQTGWDQNIKSFFIKYAISDEKFPHAEVKLFKKDGTLINVIFHNLRNHYNFKFVATIQFLSLGGENLHSVSPSFHLQIKNNIILYQPSFHLFDTTNTTSRTLTCTTTLPQINSFKICNQTNNVQEIEINQNLKMNVAYFFQNYLKDCEFYVQVEFS